MTTAFQLARLRVAVATGRLPADLGRWVLEQVVDLAPAAARIELRNALLREAALLVPGSTWAKARALRDELAAMGRRTAVVGELRELLAEARELDPDCPRSVRHLLRILGGDNEGAYRVTTIGDRLDL